MGPEKRRHPTQCFPKYWTVASLSMPTKSQNGLSPFNPSSVAIEAGRLMLKRIGELLSAGVSFSVETTLSTRSYINLIHQAQSQGYSVSLI